MKLNFLFLTLVLILSTAVKAQEPDSSTVTADTLVNVPVQTYTYKILLKQVYGERFIYNVTSATIAYKGSYTTKEKKNHFSVFRFVDESTNKQYALVYNYRNKKLYQSEWFDQDTIADKMPELKINFKKSRARINYADDVQNTDNVKLSQIAYKEPE